MSEQLMRRMPAMTNDWSMGLASGVALTGEEARSYGHALERGDREAAREKEEALVRAIETANSAYFRFDLEGAIGIDEPSLLDFPLGQTSRDLGLGLTPDYSIRKLVALLVVGANGSDLSIEMDGIEKSTEVAVGRIILFPSYCSVSLRGSESSRLSVAAFHAFGPAFR